MKKSIAIILSIMLVLAITLPATALSTIAVKSIKLNSSKVVLKVGSTYTLKVTLTPTNTTQKLLTYATSNKKIAIVNATGKITAVGAGTAVIRVYTLNKKIYANCNVTVTKKPVVTITKLMSPGSAAQWNNLNANTNVTKKAILNATGVNLVLVDADPSKAKVLLAGGSLPDLVDPAAMGMSRDDLMKTNSLLPLDSLLETNGKDIMQNIPKSMALSKAYWSNNTGKTYFIPMEVGVNKGTQEMGMGVCIRWDYYKEIGAPNIANDDDLVAVLAKMVKNHPKTPEGKPTYGISAFTDWGMNYQYAYLANSLWGYCGYGGNTVGYDIESQVAKNYYLDLNASYWRYVTFLYKANKAGIFDKDGLNQKWDDFSAKMSAGQVMMSEAPWAVGTFNTDHLNEGTGYIVIPTIGLTAFSGQIDITGWGYPNAITKNCKNPDRAMDLINYWTSYKGSREMLSGLEGQQWDTVNGKAVLRDSAIEAPTKNPDQWNKIFSPLGANFAGMNAFTIDPADKQPVGLFVTPKALSSGLSKLQKDFDSYYKVSYPYQIFEKLVAAGTIKNRSKTNTLANACLQVAMSDDLKLIDANLVNKATIDFAKCVLSESDAEFKANQAAAINDFKAAGAQKLGDFYIEAWKQAVETASKIK